MHISGELFTFKRLKGDGIVSYVKWMLFWDLDDE